MELPLQTKKSFKLMRSSEEAELAGKRYLIEKCVKMRLSLRKSAEKAVAATASPLDTTGGSSSSNRLQAETIADIADNWNIEW